MFDNQGVKINLLRCLNDAFRNGADWVDWQVKISAKQVPVRLIGLKTPKEVAEKRVEKAKNNRHSKSNHSEQYYEMLNYAILITNVDDKVTSTTSSAPGICIKMANRMHIQMLEISYESSKAVYRQKIQ